MPTELEKKKVAAIQKEREEWDRRIVTVLRAVRDDADLTQEQMADRLGLTYRQYVNMEQGRREIRGSDIIMIANAAGEKPEAVFRRIVSW